MPPLRSLLAFEAAARHGSFTDGAMEIGISPSAVSHHIQQLESFLGVPLFQRHAGRAILTAAGRTYSREMEHAFSAIANATSLVAPHTQDGHLSIAVANSFSVKWLQPRFESFLKANPQIEVRLSTLHTHELEANHYDIAIAHGPQRPGLKPGEPLLSERLRPLCSPRLVDTLCLRHPRDLVRAPLIHSNTPLTWVEYFRRIGVPAPQAAGHLWLDRSAMAIEVAVKGLGLVLESEVLAQAELRDGRLVAPFSDPAHEVEIVTYFLIRSSSLRRAAEASIFERWIRSEIRSADLTTLA